jgi:hypothetical protein
VRHQRLTGVGLLFSARRESPHFNKRNFPALFMLLLRNLRANRREYRGVGKWRTINVWSYATTRFATQHNVSFINDPAFQRSYDRAVEAAGDDWWNVGLHFRLHQAIWCANHAIGLEGDFVELGTGRGMMMSAVLEALPTWDKSGKHLFLCDTFQPFGVDTTTGQQRSSAGINPIYAESLTKVADTFRNRMNVTFVEGLLPDSLSQLVAKAIAFLHIDLNSAIPEVESLEILWPRLSRGALVLLDDYAYVGSESQYEAMNKFAEKIDVKILTLATGQGLLIKP